MPLSDQKIKEFVKEQQDEVETAIVGLGQYVVRSEYEQFKVQSSKWFTMLNEDQKKSALKKFNVASVDDKHHGSERKRLVNTTGTDLMGHSNTERQLTMNVATASEITALPTLFLRQVWSKSLELLNKGQVAKSPCSDSKSRVVASTSTKRPHFVAVNEKYPNLFECDENCPGFSEQHLCSHCIAAAEDNFLLKQYLEAYSHFAKTPKGRKQVTPNFTRVSMSGLPRGTAGRKGNKHAKHKAVKRRKVEENRRDVPMPILSTMEGNQASSHSDIATGHSSKCFDPSREWSNPLPPEERYSSYSYYPYRPPSSWHSTTNIPLVHPVNMHGHHGTSNNHHIHHFPPTSLTQLVIHTHSSRST